MATFVMAMALVLSVVGGLACDAEFTQTPPSEICVEVAVQCQLPEGPLGVCEQTSCSVGMNAPCFKCTSQH